MTEGETVGESSKANSGGGESSDLRGIGDDSSDVTGESGM
jgi:hypothetical protein